LSYFLCKIFHLLYVYGPENAKKSAFRDKKLKKVEKKLGGTAPWSALPQYGGGDPRPMSSPARGASILNPRSLGTPLALRR